MKTLLVTINSNCDKVKGLEGNSNSASCDANKFAFVQFSVLKFPLEITAWLKSVLKCLALMISDSKESCASVKAVMSKSLAESSIPFVFTFLSKLFTSLKSFAFISEAESVIFWGITEGMAETLEIVKVETVEGEISFTEPGIFPAKHIPHNDFNKTIPNLFSGRTEVFTQEKK